MSKEKKECITDSRHNKYNKYEDPERFNKEKDKILARKDQSKIGRVDDEVKDIVDEINKKPDFCTTSSCAGRITLIERKTDRKIDANWLVSSHQPVSFGDIKTKLKSEHDAWLMQESFILHVFCRTLESANRFLKLCKNLGFKRTGITGIEDKIGIECLGNEKVEAIVIKNGKIVADDDYLRVIVGECNKRMKKNREKLGKLYAEIKKL